MITTLERINTRIAIIHNIPKFFFKNLENAMVFGDHLFPAWEKTIFIKTDLRKKFEAVFVNYKSISSKKSRYKIVDAFTNLNQIEILCNNTTNLAIYELNDLPTTVRKELDALFEYLYKSAINYHLFEKYVNDNVSDSITRFIQMNELEVCPFCGLEGFLNIEGQARLALDHWLCRDLFPMSAVNFNNLIPIGPSCNARPAKGSKNILLDDNLSKNRVVAYYPFVRHSGIQTKFKFITEPTITTYNNIPESDWELSIDPLSLQENDIYKSWLSTMNIEQRYLGYIKTNILS
ncbi:MAG: hypothetical protein EOO19_16260, partial [Chryseobacterium sp.]